MSATPDQIQDHIRHTREDLSANLCELEHKVIRPAAPAAARLATPPSSPMHPVGEQEDTIGQITGGPRSPPHVGRRAMADGRQTPGSTGSVN